MASEKYNHGRESAALDDIAGELDTLMEGVQRKILQAHILQVELATIMEPTVLDNVRQAVAHCDTCSQHVPAPMQIDDAVDA